MGNWDLAIALDRTNAEPLYLQLVKALEEGIRHGRFKPGGALPGTRALADQLGVNRNTTLAAYKELEAEGWIEVLPDKGTFVARKLPIVLGAPTGISAQDSASWKRATPRSEPFFQPGAPALESFQLIPDVPDLRLAPTDAIHRAYGRVLKLHPERLLQPGWDPRGMLDLRNSLCTMLREMRGLSIEAGNLLLTRGLMSTLNLVSRVLFAPGEAVAVENPGWFRVAEAFKAAGARLFPIPVDEHGLDVEAFEALLIQEPIRLLYLTASPQHPTQVTLDPARRRRLLELSRAHGFRILEGDPCLGFHREKNPSLPLASEDLHGRVLYFSSFEQILAPGLQVGFLAGEASLIKALAQQRQLVDWPGNLVQEATIEETLRDGEIVRHLRRIRKVTEERRETMVDRLLLHLHPALSVVNPREGLSLWIRVADEVPLEAWTERCLAHGVVFYPGALYDFHHRNLPYICLGFAAHDLEEQNEACTRMAVALKEVQGVRRS
ncbi:MAG TPA: PLP-dependent aminotransferase family protein [Geothrix sp.]|nr:PLP-dependent aminotransferase family protein [Geothrix sp.]